MKPCILNISLIVTSIRLWAMNQFLGQTLSLCLFGANGWKESLVCLDVYMAGPGAQIFLVFIFGIGWMNILKNWNGLEGIVSEGPGALHPLPLNGPLLSDFYCVAFSCMAVHFDNVLVTTRLAHYRLLLCLVVV
jgi:hypothetical protein